MTNYSYLRHGQSTANVEKVVGGWTDVELTPDGIKEAIRAGEEGARLKVSFDRIISSPLSRAYTTAEIVAQNLGYALHAIEIHGGLKEKGGGKFELQPLERFYGMSEEELAEGGAETAAAFRERIINTSKDLYQRTSHMDNVLIVAHAGVYKIAKTVIDNQEPTAMYKIESPPNATMMSFPLEILASY